MRWLKKITSTHNKNLKSNTFSFKSALNLTAIHKHILITIALESFV